MKLSKLIPFLLCPQCKNEFELKDLKILSTLKEDIFGWLICQACNIYYPITYNIINLLTEFNEDDLALLDMEHFLVSNNFDKEQFNKIKLIYNREKKQEAKLNWQSYYKNLETIKIKNFSEKLAMNSHSSIFHCIHQFILKNGGSKKRIFEIGIGTGDFSLNLAIKGYEVYGVDYSYLALKRLNEYASNESFSDKVGVIRADFEKIPFKPVFSHVLSLGFIEHFNDPQKIVFKHRSFCQDGGYLFLDVPNSRSIWMKIYALKRWIEQRNGHWRVGLEKSFSIKELSKFLKSANFEVLEKYCLDFESSVRSALSLKVVTPIEKLLKYFFFLIYIATIPFLKLIPEKKFSKYGFFAIIHGRKIKKTF